MSDSNRRPCVQAKLKELIERASSAADANLHRRRKPYPLGFAVRANGSKFAFRPESIEDEGNDTVVAHIRTLFLQNNVVQRLRAMTFSSLSIQTSASFKFSLVAAILAIRSKFVTEVSGFAASACSFRIMGKAAVILQTYRQVSCCANPPSLPCPSTGSSTATTIKSRSSSSLVLPSFM